MKMLILSDSHGNIENMVRAVEQTTPRMIFHLGDCWRDAEALQDLFPHILMEQVPGNCDFRPDLPAEKLIFAEDKRVLLCHGHTYGVKNSLLTAGYAAEEQNLDLFLFGHTHQPLIDRRGKCWFVNPGSIGDYRRPTYAIVTVFNGEITARTVLLNE